MEYIDKLIKFSKIYPYIKIKKIDKNSTITNYIAKRNQIYILTNGEAALIRYDANGNKTIIEYFTEGNVFGEMFYSVNTSSELSVIAQKNCKVIYFNYNDLIENSNLELLDILVDILSTKATNTNDRIEVLTKRTIREKLLAYFSSISSKYHSKAFFLPMCYSDLADYLSIDRSAMMREIKNLTIEGFIKKNKRRITLLY